MSGIDPNSRFGLISFGVVGLLYGILQSAPWVSSDAIFLNTIAWRLAWSLLFAVAPAFFGWRRGAQFIETARSGHFSRAAALMIPALLASAVVFCLSYFVLIVAAGDFGQSYGIFGSFHPTTIPQKLAGAVMVALTGLLRMGRSSVTVGFGAGYVLALFFDPQWKNERD